MTENNTINNTINEAINDVKTNQWQNIVVGGNVGKSGSITNDQVSQLSVTITNLLINNSGLATAIEDVISNKQSTIVENPISKVLDSVSSGLSKAINSMGTAIGGIIGSTLSPIQNIAIFFIIGCAIVLIFFFNDGGVDALHDLVNQ
jgi:uncharacterized membrane protein YheB (UPF0754 family)